MTEVIFNVVGPLRKPRSYRADTFQIQSRDCEPSNLAQGRPFRPALRPMRSARAVGDLRLSCEARRRRADFSVIDRRPPPGNRALVFQIETHHL